MCASHEYWIATAILRFLFWELPMEDLEQPALAQQNAFDCMILDIGIRSFCDQSPPFAETEHTLVHTPCSFLESH